MKKIFIAAGKKTPYDSSLIMIYFLLMTEFMFSSGIIPYSAPYKASAALPAFVIPLILLILLKICFGAELPRHKKLISVLLSAVMICYILAGMQHVFRAAYSYYIFT